jgi:hypothetical protein
MGFNTAFKGLILSDSEPFQVLVCSCLHAVWICIQTSVLLYLDVLKTCILLSVYVDGCINCKKAQHMSNIQEMGRNIFE